MTSTLTPKFYIFSYPDPAGWSNLNKSSQKYKKSYNLTKLSTQLKFKGYAHESVRLQVSLRIQASGLQLEAERPPHTLTANFCLHTIGILENIALAETKNIANELRVEIAVVIFGNTTHICYHIWNSSVSTTTMNKYATHVNKHEEIIIKMHPPGL